MKTPLNEAMAGLGALALAVATAPADAQTSCTPDPASPRVVYAISLNSRLFFSPSSQVDTPLANPQTLTALLRPTAQNPDTLVFGITLFDYSTGTARVLDADQVPGSFEIRMVPMGLTATPANTVIGLPTGGFFKDFVVFRSDLGGRNAKLARVEIPTKEVFDRLPTVAGNPSLAIGTVLGLLRDPSGAVVACSYMSPFGRYIGFSREGERALTTAPNPFVVARGDTGGGIAEVVQIEPMNVTTRFGGTNYEIGLIADPPALPGVATSPANNSNAYDFAVTFVRYDPATGAPSVFTDSVCGSPTNQYGRVRLASGGTYPPGTRLKVRLRPLQGGTRTVTEQIEAEWNGRDTIVLPLVDSLDATRVRFFCVAKISIPICSVKHLLGPLPGFDRRVRVGLVEGIHEIPGSGSASLQKSGFYNRQNRFFVGSRELSEVSTSVAQPVMFLADPEPACGSS
jgi:hypothetical protein